MLSNNLNELSKKIYESNKAAGWWSDRDETWRYEAEVMKDKECKKLLAMLVSSKIALIHSETSEALEGMRKSLNDDHLPNRPMIEVELADTVIRILDLAGFLGLDIEGAVVDKFNYNQKRLDHKKENREAAGGKTI